MCHVRKLVWQTHPCVLTVTKGKAVGEVGGERLRDGCNTDLCKNKARDVLRAVRGARALSEFPLVSVLCFVQVCVSLSL